MRKLFDLRVSSLAVLAFVATMICWGAIFLTAPANNSVARGPDSAATNIAVFATVLFLIAFALLVARGILNFFLYRRVRCLGLRAWRLSSSLKTSMATTIREADDESLLGASHLPDQRYLRPRIAEELARRGIEPSRIDSWVQPARHLTLPTFRHKNAESLAEVRTQADANFFLFKALRFLAVLILFLLVLGVASSLSFFVLWSPSREPTAAREFLRLEGIFFRNVLTPLFILCLTLIAGFIFWGGLSGRQSDLRMLLLRPFGDRRMTRALKAVVLKNLGGFGHVYTLSDKNYQPNPFIRMFDMIVTGLRYVVGPAFRPSQRIATVSSERSYLVFAVKLSRRLRQSFRRVATGGQAVNLKSTDAWWQRCVELLMHSCDLIVMDLSRVKAGSAWEITQLARRGLLPRILFIVQEDYAKSAETILNELLPQTDAISIYAFTRTGEFVDPIALTGALNAQLARLLTERAGR